MMPWRIGSKSWSVIEHHSLITRHWQAFLSIHALSLAISCSLCCKFLGRIGRLPRFTGVVQGETLSSYAIKALEALVQAFGREQDMTMVDLVLEDSLIRDLLDDAVDPAQRGGLAGSAMRLEAATPVLACVSPLLLHERGTCHQQGYSLKVAAQSAQTSHPAPMMARLLQIPLMSWALVYRSMK